MNQILNLKIATKVNLLYYKRPLWDKINTIWPQLQNCINRSNTLLNVLVMRLTFKEMRFFLGLIKEVNRIFSSDFPNKPQKWKKRPYFLSQLVKLSYFYFFICVKALFYSAIHFAYFEEDMFYSKLNNYLIRIKMLSAFVNKDVVWEKA